MVRRTLAFMYEADDEADELTAPKVSASSIVIGDKADMALDLAALADGVVAKQDANGRAR